MLGGMSRNLLKRILQLRVDDATHAELASEAERQGRSLSNLARAVLREWAQDRERVRRSGGVNAAA